MTHTQHDPAPFLDAHLNPITASRVTDALHGLAELTFRLGEVPRVTFHPGYPARVVPESDTTHTVMTVYAACSLAEMLNVDVDSPQFDIGVVAQEAAAHDLHEAYASDVDTTRPLDDGQRQDKRAAEDQAAMRIVVEHSTVFPWMAIARPAGEGPESLERRLVRFVDKVLPKLAHLSSGCADLRDRGITPDDLRRLFFVQRAELITDVVYDFPHVIAIYDDVTARVLAQLETIAGD